MSIMQINERSEVPFFPYAKDKAFLRGLRTLFSRVANIVSVGTAVAAKEENASGILICNSGFLSLLFDIS
jgi:hypothetical protein